MSLPDVSTLSRTPLGSWMAIASVVVFATTGDILVAAAMRRTGDLGQVFRSSGTTGVLKKVFSAPLLFAGIAAMALSFFSLLFALSRAELSLVAPATASLTFVAAAAAAKLFLHEEVGRRRWAAAICVCVGVALLAY